jgi:hypothetical protein
MSKKPSPRPSHREDACTAFPASTRKEGLYKCPRCSGVVTAGDVPGVWVTPVKGDAHDCTTWLQRLAACGLGGEDGRHC